MGEHGLRYEADPRHVELLARSLNLEQCNHMLTPGVKVPFDEADANANVDDLNNYVADTGVNVLKHRSPIVRLSM